MRIYSTKTPTILYATIVLVGLSCSGMAFGQGSHSNKHNEITVLKSSDFKPDGRGSAAQWQETDWTIIPLRGGSSTYETSAKLLYSDNGIYCLFRCEDEEITSTLSEDFADLWTEDVVEIFFWPDEAFPVYFEYELSPRNYELPILVPNKNGSFLGWRPWKYSGDRKVTHATHISNDDGQSTWFAEFFIPFDLLKPLIDETPSSDTRWRMNMYRLDYDEGQSRWAWQAITTNFHDYDHYGTMVFR